MQRVRVHLVATRASADVQVEGNSILGVEMTVDVWVRYGVLKPGHARRAVVLRHCLEEQPEIQVVPKKGEKVESLN